MITRWTRSRAFSLASRWLTWVLVVAALIESLSAISVLDRPVAMSASTSRSRVVMAAMAVGAWVAGAGGAGRRTNSATSRRVTLGASSASPAATTLIAAIRSAGWVLLSRKPLA